MKKHIIVHFEDNGQDFLIWEIDPDTGNIVACTPFQDWLWCKFTMLTPQEELFPGGFITVYRKDTEDKPTEIKHRIERVILPDEVEEPQPTTTA
jgi:hypothetical protein